MSDRATILLLLAQAQDLAELRDWPPARNLVDAVVDIARGHGSLSAREAARLNTWARRWTRLHPRLRAWYSERSGHPAVSTALWSILAHYPRPDGPRLWRLHQLWEDDHGARAGFDLIPIIP